MSPCGTFRHPQAAEAGTWRRITTFPFLWFLEKNGVLYRDDGSRLVDNNTLVALAPMTAESRTEEKEIMTKVVVNLINRND